MNTLQLYQTPKRRVNVSLPTDLLKVIDQTFPHKNRSQVIAEATAKQIVETKKHQLEQNLKKGFQFTKKIVLDEHKTWEKILIHDASSETYEV